MDYRLVDRLSEISENIEIVKHERRLEKSILNDAFFKEYKGNIAKEETAKYFLTVLIRTQGKRMEGLRECLLCLQAQTIDDFEIIIIGHKVAEENENDIIALIDEQTDCIKKKIRYVPLQHGSRTVPLNLGFSLARGRYVSVYDDDDLLFENWVESFVQLAGEEDGRILRTYALSQTWKQTSDGNYQAKTKYEATYCNEFDLIEQLVVNRCPLMTMAFPTYLFQQLGITFNENLNTTEDWDYLMRTVYVCGMSEIDKPTAIYRFWENVETSATVHSQKIWDEAYAEISKGITQNGLYFPPNEAHRLIENYIRRDLVQCCQEGMWRLYYSSGRPFDDNYMIATNNRGSYPFFDCLFHMEKCLDRIQAMRFDVGYEGVFVLKEFVVELVYIDNTREMIRLEQCAHTGIKMFGELIFLFNGPTIVWEVRNERIKYIHVSGTISHSISRGGISKKLFEISHSLRFQVRNRRMHNKGWF